VINAVVKTVIETDAFDVICDDVVRKSVIDRVIDFYATIVV